MIHFGMAKGVQIETECCGFNNSPWFYKKLGDDIESTSDIEMRVCRNQESDNEDIRFQRVEIYVA